MKKKNRKKLLEKIAEQNKIEEIKKEAQAAVKLEEPASDYAEQFMKQLIERVSYQAAQDLMNKIERGS